MSLSSGDILKIVATLVFSDGNVIQNVFSILLSGAGGPWDDLDVSSDVLDYIDNLYDQFVNQIDDDLDGTDVDVYVYDPGDQDFDFVANEPWDWVGLSNGSSMPRGVAGLVNAPTTDPDVNAKKYLGGWTEEAFSAGTFTGGSLAEIVDWATAWIAAGVGAASGATLTPGCWSVKDLDHYSFRGAFATTAIAAYQRRRKRGVGI